MRGLFIAFPLALASVAIAGPISIPTSTAPSTPDFTAMPRMTAASAAVAAPPAPTTTTAAPIVTAHTTLITMASDLEPRKHKNNHHQHDKDHYGYGGCSEYWDGRLITNCPSVIATTLDYHGTHPLMTLEGGRPES
ncbi:hypothetical protein J4E85_010847 [Alternaria conjuncta]|uniref:uncharacterized protein n=1 Tax=Alternaria conjuncta TaxID=181017 RepID=UPI00221F8723|nr:uncharacterized protein J4E85_010847 [Alternaria conjuncta]KAI4913115.1 hypothetical protein J4E85_010847 [Alternaria conjuncta]